MSDRSEVTKFIRMPAVIKATGRVCQAIYENMKTATFPKAVRIGPR
jgi:prophage regulatory protein